MSVGYVQFVSTVGDVRVALPDYVSRPLARSPLVLVAAQLTFEEIGPGVLHAQAREIQGAVGSRWTRLQAQSMVATTATPGGAVSDPRRAAYRLSSGDAQWSALLSPDSVAVETRVYAGWSEMRDTILSFAAAVASVFDPASEIRLGLRYIDQVVLPRGRPGWAGLIPDSLLGITLDAQFASAVLASEQQVVLALDDQSRCLFRHGRLADQAGQPGKYLLDYDVYRENAGPFAFDLLAEGIDTLHSYVGQLFRASISDELYAELGR